MDPFILSPRDLREAQSRCCLHRAHKIGVAMKPLARTHPEVSAKESKPPASYRVVSLFSIVTIGPASRALERD